MGGRSGPCPGASAELVGRAEEGGVVARRSAGPGAHPVGGSHGAARPPSLPPASHAGPWSVSGQVTGTYFLVLGIWALHFRDGASPEHLVGPCSFRQTCVRAAAGPATSEARSGASVGGRARGSPSRSGGRRWSVGRALWRVSVSSLKCACCSSDFGYVHIDLKTIF